MAYWNPNPTPAQAANIARTQALLARVNSPSSASYGSNASLANVTATYESRIKELQDMMTQQSLAQQQQQQRMQQSLAAQQQQMQQSLAAQQQNFATQQQQMQERFAAQQAAYYKEAQLTANAQRAYTPAPEATATETTTTDSGLSNRRTAQSRLSSLAIIEGLGTNANPLSGLQLA